MVGTASAKLVTMVGTAIRTRSLCQWLVRRSEPEACDNGWYGDKNQKLVTMVGTASTKIVTMVGTASTKLVPMVGTAIRTRSL